MAKSSAKNLAFVEKVNAKYKGGSAPLVTEENYRLEYPRALAYHALNTENKQLAKAVYAYLKKTNTEYVSVIKKAPDWELLTIGKVICVINDGGWIQQKDYVYLETKLNELYIKYKNIQSMKVEDENTVQKPKAPAISIEQRIIDSARAQSEEIDYAIDEYINEKSSTFTTKALLLKNSISGAVAKRIGEYYQNPLNEINEAIAGTCDQLSEGYSFFTKVELKKFRDFLQSIVDDCKQHAVIVKKPRIVKPKPAGVLVKKMKYMIEFKELNMRSINPAEIVNADVAYIYNTKTRKLSRYEADDRETLSVKGTTIINYSVSNSDSKTIRKPEDFFKKLDLGKRAMNKLFTDLKTKPSEPSGRVNTDCIIIGAF